MNQSDVAQMTKGADVAVVILAAGQSTRMKSQLSKMLHPLCGRPIVRYVTDLVDAVCARRAVMVLGYQADRIQKELQDTRIEFVYQKEQLGTAHAVLQTKDALADFSGVVLVLNGDTPLLTSREVNELVAFHCNSRAACTILSSDIPDPFSYGRILRDETGSVLGIVEEKDASKEQKKIKEINAGIYCFDSRALYDTLNKINNRNAKKEYYLTDSIAILRQEGKVVQAFKAADYRTSLGINTRGNLAEASQIMRQRIATRLMEEGVTIIDPAHTYIDFEVQIGQDTVVWPDCVIEGGSSIGKGCHIGPFSWIVRSTLEDGVYVEGGCILRDSTLSAGSRIPSSGQICQEPVRTIIHDVREES
ncbi:MAG: sugar phosphate nucleotidyltransferase [bacterium]